MRVEFGDERLPERFWSKVRPTPSGCWEWTASRNGGYGGYVHNGRGVKAHRLMCAVAHGASGLLALHSCDNKLCVNPEHLRWGTQQNNMDDMQQRGRSRRGVRNASVTHCPQGHPYDERNTYRRPGFNSRACRECVRKHTRESHRRQRGVAG